MSNESPSLVSRFLRSVQPEGSTPAAPKTEKELDDLLENHLKDASPEEATSIRNAAKMLRKADKYGPVDVTARDNTTASRAYRNRPKHDKYNFLAGMLLSKSGLAKSDPQLAGLAKMFLNNPAKYGKNPEKLLFDAVTRPKHRRGRRGKNRRRGGGARGRGRGRTRGRGRGRGRGGGRSRGRGRGGGQRAAVSSKESNPAALSAGPSSSHAPGQSSQQQQQLNVDSGASGESSGFRQSFRNNFAKALNFGATALQKKKKPKVREGLSDEPTFARPPAFRPGSKQVVNHAEGNTLTPDQPYSSSSFSEFNDYSSSSSEDEIEHGEGEHSGQHDDEHHEGYDDVHDDEYDERPHDEYEQDFEDEYDGDYCEDEEQGLEEALAGTSLNDNSDGHHDEEYNDDEDDGDVEEEENDCEEAEQQDEYEQDFEDEHDGDYSEDEEALAGTSSNDNNDGHHDEEYNDDEDYGDVEEEENDCEEAEQELINEMERDEEVSKQEYEEQVGQAEHYYSHDVLEQVQAIGNIISEEHAADEECEHDEETVVHDYLHDIREEEHATTEYSFQHEDGGDNSYQIEHDQNEYAHDWEEAVDDYGHDGADFECGDYYGGDDYEE